MACVRVSATQLCLRQLMPEVATFKRHKIVSLKEPNQANSTTQWSLLLSPPPLLLLSALRMSGHSPPSMANKSKMALATLDDPWPWSTSHREFTSTVSCERKLLRGSFSVDILLIWLSCMLFLTMHHLHHVFINLVACPKNNGERSKRPRLTKPKERIWGRLELHLSNRVRSVNGKRQEERTYSLWILNRSRAKMRFPTCEFMYVCIMHYFGSSNNVIANLLLFCQLLIS